MPARWNYSRIGRAAGLILLLVSIFGPWVYDADGVPPPEWCHEPLVLVETGRCVRLVSGAEIMSFMGGAFVTVIPGVIMGTSYRLMEVVGPLAAFLLPGLPVLTTLLLIWYDHHPRLRIAHLIVSALGGCAALILALSLPDLRSVLFWGIWLYICLATASLILEGLAMVKRKPVFSPTPRFS